MKKVPVKTLILVRYKGEWGGGPKQSQIYVTSFMNDPLIAIECLPSWGLEQVKIFKNIEIWFFFEI